TREQGVQLAAPGNILIGGNITTDSVVSGHTAGELAILSGGDIKTTLAGAPYTISTRGAGGGVNPGGRVTMIAGANLQTTGTADEIKVTGGSTTGGSVHLESGVSAAGASIDTRTTANSSGEVRIAAFHGTDVNSGHVNTLTSALGIDTSGGLFQGLISIYAGATSGTSIVLGDIRSNNNNSTFSGGNIDVKTATPNVNSFLGGLT